MLVFSDAAFRAINGKASYDFLVKSKGFAFHAAACQGPKVFSSKEAEERAVCFAVMIAKAKGFPKVCVLLDAKEVVNGCYAINPIILDIKLSLIFYLCPYFLLFLGLRMRVLTYLLN